MTIETKIDDRTHTPDTTTAADGSNSTKTTMIILRSQDGREFELPLIAAKASVLINDALGGDDDDDDDDDDEHHGHDEKLKEIEVMRVNGECLEKVVEFLIHHNKEPMQDIETPLQGNSFEEAMPQQWYRNFVSLEFLPQETLFDMLTAANYMGIKQLLDLACLRVTFLLTGRNAEEIRQILNLPEMTPEEEQRAREEHRWIFEDEFP